jgi:hypothetical protein
VPVDYLDQGYQRAAKGKGGASYFTPDDRTLILARESDLQFLMRAAKGSGSHHAWDDAWRQVEKGQVTLALGTRMLSQRVLPNLSRPYALESALAEAFSPLWMKAHDYAISLDVSKDLSIDLVASCGSHEDAKKVDWTARAVLTLAFNVMVGFREKIAVAPREAVERMQFLADTFGPLLEKASSEQEGRMVHVRSSTDMDLGAVVKVLLPAVQSSRSAARHARSMNNLKQLALAMLNYHDAHGNLPPAILYGPDGKTPYSWRVALLPHLEQQSLYDQYKFDEPWDGPHNRKLLDQIPDVFCFPDNVAGRKLAYFALVGPETLFGVEGGTSIAQVTDGAFSTLMFVEARRDIPWTKPEDIPYDASKPLPEIGGLSPGGFNAAFTDGSVRFLSSTIDEKVLRALLTRAGREVIDTSAFR